MEVLLLQDISGVGKKNDLIVVGNGFALNCLLPNKQALVATPAVRKRYAEQIRVRAEERERERARQAGAAAALTGKKVTVSKKAAEHNKLYAAVSEKDVVEAALAQLNVELDEKSIQFKEAIKELGTFDVTVKLGATEEVLKVEVKEEGEEE